MNWKYDPPREYPHEPGDPTFAESCGSISLEYDQHHKILKPNQEGLFFLNLWDPLAQPIVDTLAPDVPDENITITVDASSWEWCAGGDELPGTIREFARAVLHDQQRTT